MYAVIQSGGKQYKVAVGDKLKLESLDVDEGDSIEFDKVLAVGGDGGLEIGTPTPIHIRYRQGARQRQR